MPLASEAVLLQWFRRRSSQVDEGVLASNRDSSTPNSVHTQHGDIAVPYHRFGPIPKHRLIKPAKDADVGQVLADLHGLKGIAKVSAGLTGTTSKYRVGGGDGRREGSKEEQ